MCRESRSVRDIFPCQVKSPKQARTRQGLITGFALFGNTQMRSTQLFQMEEQQNAVDLAILNLLSHLLSKVKQLEKTTFPSQIQTKLFLWSRPKQPFYTHTTNLFTMQQEKKIIEVSGDVWP